MIVGSTLFKMIGDPYLSPQFNRGGLAAVFSCQVLQVSGTTPTFDVDVQHKNAEDSRLSGGRTEQQAGPQDSPSQEWDTLG